VVAPVLQRFLVFAFEVSITLPPWQNVVAPLAVIIGRGGIEFGLEDMAAGALVHPLTAVCVTVYVAALETILVAVVIPLLHNNDPVKLEAVKTELPQLFTTLTEGDEGTAFGAEATLPAGLTHPLIVWVTV
jgi:hypothetical protein